MTISFSPASFSSASHAAYACFASSTYSGVWYESRMMHEWSCEAPRAWPILVRYALYGAVFWLVLLWGDFAGAQFIYFQF